MSETSTPPAPVHYRLDPINPGAHLFAVTLTLSEVNEKGEQITLPAWIPGSYTLRDFAANIVTIEAHCGDNSIVLQKIDKQTWSAPPCPAPLTVSYTVYAYDLSVRGAHLDTDHGYFNGTSLFLQVKGRERSPVVLELHPPEGNSYRHWRVATTLPRLQAPVWGFGSYRADDYEELIDHPVEMGAFDIVEFSALDTPHAMVISGLHHGDTGRLARDLQPLCEAQITLFGELPPMERYLFLTQVVDEGYGGLEHRSSSSLLCSRRDLPQVNDSTTSDHYRDLLGLCSHEYFHTWNIKRIKPKCFIPYDLSREVHTGLLWAFEGFTAYYDDLLLCRSGLILAESYLELLGQTITRLLRGSGRLKQSVSESSFDSWTRFYRQNENSPNALVSYYTKGSLIALCLDLMIRLESGGERSLDDVMRALWQRHGRAHVGVSDQGLEQLISEVGGLELKSFFTLALRTTKELPIAALLQQMGVQHHLRAAESPGDKGGTPTGENPVLPPTLGLRGTKDGGLGVIVKYVADGGAAQLAGISAGDRIVAINALEVKVDDIDEMLAPYISGEQVDCHLFRRGELRRIEVTLQSRPLTTCYLSLAEHISHTTLTQRERWLGST